eukprot:scaffold36328_cov141-Skeletonema_marinoi.AAC.4
MLGVQGKVTGFDALLEEYNMSQIQIISQEKEIGILHQGQVGREMYGKIRLKYGNSNRSVAYLLRMLPLAD